MYIESSVFNSQLDYCEFMQLVLFHWCNPLLCLIKFRLCVMHTLQLENPFPPTRDMQLPRFSAILMLLLKYHGIFFCYFAHCNNLFATCLFCSDQQLLYDLWLGMVLSKNTPCCRKTSIGLLVGQLVVFLDLRWKLTFIHH